MMARRTALRGWRTRLLSGVATAAAVGLGGAAAAQMSELDAFQRAVNTQSEQDAHAFVEQFGSSHLVPDLIDLLPPEVAMAVCASLGAGSSRTAAACTAVPLEMATIPAAGPAIEETEDIADDDVPDAASSLAARVGGQGDGAGSLLRHVVDPGTGTSGSGTPGGGSSNSGGSAGGSGSGDSTSDGSEGSSSGGSGGSSSGGSDSADGSGSGSDSGADNGNGKGKGKGKGPGGGGPLGGLLGGGAGGLGGLLGGKGS